MLARKLFEAVPIAAHCVIRPILLFRKWEDVSRAIIGVTMWWECVELSPHHFRAAQAHALASRPEMALSRLDVYSAAHCAIRPLSLFRKWEDVSRAIIGVAMWWECVELSPHHFQVAQAHALASRPEMALSRLDVYSAAHCAIRPILLFRKWEDVSRAIIGVTMWWECVDMSPHHFRAAQAHALASRPEMALSRQDVYSAAHCAIRPLLLFRRWEDVSRAIIVVNVWWKCVELSPHHFRAAQAHALASRPEMALSRLDVSTAAHCIIRPLLISQVGGCLEGNTHAQLHGGTSCAIGCPRSSCRTPSKSVRPRRMAPCEGGRRRRSSGGLPAAFARRIARQWRDTWCQRMHSCTEAHPAPSVALEAPVELPPRASALAAWHRAKAGGAVDRAEGCRRPSRGELRANGATRGVNACTAARRHILRHRLPSKLLSNSLQERPPSPHGTVRRRAAPSIERRAAGGLREEKCAPRATDGAGCASVQLCMCIALETSSHLRNNNIGRMTQCAAVGVDTSRRLSAISGLLTSACACAA